MALGFEDGVIPLLGMLFIGTFVLMWPAFIVWFVWYIHQNDRGR